MELNGRVPTKEKDGSPVLCWDRDKFGEKVGDAPVPIRPEYLFLVENRKFRFVPVDEE